MLRSPRAAWDTRGYCSKYDSSSFSLQRHCSGRGAFLHESLWVLDKGLFR